MQYKLYYTALHINSIIQITIIWRLNATQTICCYLEYIL